MEDGQGQWILGTALQSYVDLGDLLCYYVVEFGSPEGTLCILSCNYESVLRAEGRLHHLGDENVLPFSEVEGSGMPPVDVDLGEEVVGGGWRKCQFLGWDG